MAIDMKISPAELGRRIMEARSSRRLTQEEVSTHLGLSRPTYIAIEKGNRPAKPEEIISLASLFGRTVHDLVSEQAVITEFIPQFRVSEAFKISKEHVAEAVQEFQNLCENYLTLENISGSPMPRSSYPDYSNVVQNTPIAVAAAQIAQNERQRLGLGQGPLPDLRTVLEGELGLRVFIYPLTEFRIAGMFYYTDRLGGCILVNGSHPSTRQLWSMAHEFAHFLIDRHRQEVTVLYDYERKPAQEQFADRFAAEFLMPPTGVRQRFVRAVQTKDDFKVADLCLLADQYGVSIEAMARRLEALQCIPKGMANKVSGSSASRVRSALGLSTPHHKAMRLPERYQNLAVQSFVEEKITEGQLAKYLRCNRVEARERVQELTQSNELNEAGVYPLDLNFGEVVVTMRQGNEALSSMAYPEAAGR